MGNKPGRRPIPTALKVVRGTQRKKQPAENAVLPVERPERPAFLTGRAAEEWERLIPQLERQGLLSSLDGVALAVWCQAAADFAEAVEHVNQQGPVLTSAQGGQYQNPWCAIKNRAADQIRRFSTEFGLTASARATLPAQPKKPSSEWTAFSVIDNPRKKAGI